MEVTDYWDLNQYTWVKDVGPIKVFLQGLKEKKIKGAKCHVCGIVYVPPCLICPPCFVELKQTVEVKDSGKVIGFSITYANVRGEKLEEPRIIGLIKFEGADTWVLGRVQGIALEKMKRDLPVRVIWKAATEGKLSDIDYFEVALAAAAEVV